MTNTARGEQVKGTVVQSVLRVNLCLLRYLMRNQPTYDRPYQDRPRLLT